MATIADVRVTPEAVLGTRKEIVNYKYTVSVQLTSGELFQFYLDKMMSRKQLLKELCKYASK